MHFCVNNWQLISTHTLEVYIFECNKYNSMFTYCTYSFLFINIPIWWQCYIIAPNYTRNICKEWKSKWNNNIVRTHLYIVYKALNVTFMNYSSNRIKIILKNMIWSWGGGGRRGKGVFLCLNWRSFMSNNCYQYNKGLTSWFLKRNCRRIVGNCFWVSNSSEGCF